MDDPTLLHKLESPLGRFVSCLRGRAPCHFDLANLVLCEAAPGLGPAAPKLLFRAPPGASATDPPHAHCLQRHRDRTRQGRADSPRLALHHWLTGHGGPRLSPGFRRGDICLRLPHV